MFRKKFSFCGLCLELISENEIRNSHFFSEFFSDEKPDLTVNVINCALPERKGELLFENRTSQFYSFDGKEYLFSFYYDTKIKADKDYAVRVYDGKSMTLYVDYPGGMWDGMIFDALNLPDVLVKRQSGILHSSFVFYKNKAILFSADKQVGKTTQAKLWEKHRGARMINGDRAGLMFAGGNLFACGVPYCGSSKVSFNVSAPIRAIVMLGQAKENRIEKMKEYEAFIEILGQFTYNKWDRASVESIITLTEKIVGAVPVYKLECLPDESAVEALENQLMIQERTAGAQ